MSSPTSTEDTRLIINPDNPMATAGTPLPAPAGDKPEPRTDLDLDYFRRRLDEEQALAQQTIDGTRSSDAGLNEEDEKVATEFVGSGDNHPADIATELQLREQDDALVRNAREILRQIERAQQKLDEGTYGICDKTHQPIPVERLEVLPYATLTVEAQSIAEITQ